MKNEFAQFNKLIEGQFRYGGEKYAQTSTKEATDTLFDDYGYRWLLGTVDKYTKRFSNLERERDLLKIAAYMYITWLKRGYHLNNEGVPTPINTTVEVKSKFFTDFILSAYAYYGDNQHYLETLPTNTAIEKISNVLKSFAHGEWTDVVEEKLAHIYCLSFVVWNYKYFSKGLAGQDTDTQNETKYLRETLLKAAKEVNYKYAPDFVERLIDKQVELLSKKRA